MYPHSSSAEPADEGDEASISLFTNTSTLPIFAPDGRLPDAAQFPRFYEEALPDSYEEVLEEGDLLVMPKGWWHAMRQEGAGGGFGVSFWY